MTMIPLLALITATQASAPAQDAVPLYENLGTHHVAITTRVPRAQQYFDQGLRLTYGFNHAEAIEAFNEAARLDPGCVMCYWGRAYALGPNINAPMDSSSAVAAGAAIDQALARSASTTPLEQALIRAMAARYAATPPGNRAALDSAYASEMADVVRRFPESLEAATLHADAIMNLSPWNYWERDGKPRPGTDVLMTTLEQVLATNPDHPGACHFYIHAVEAAHPDQGIACAERLARLMPGAGHIVHMPAHIYVRVGRYADAVTANEHAIHTDESYIADRRPRGLYPLAYYPHNYHFLAFAANMAGRSRVAIDAARALVPKIPVEIAKDVYFAEGIPAYLHLTLVMFGRWSEALNAPMPPAELTVATGLAHYARGVAFAATGNAAETGVALERVKQAAANAKAARPPDWPTNRVLDIATHALAGEIATRAGRLEEGIVEFGTAVEIEDQLLYDEPPLWYYPMRHSFAAVLLQAGKAVDAQRVYEEDLRRFPENGWSLFGLALALRTQGKAVEADAIEARFRRAWAQADVRLAASRF